MDKSTHSLTVDGTAVPLHRLDNLRLITPERDQDPATVAARLSQSTRLALDPAFPADRIVVWGDARKLDEVRLYDDVQNTRAAFSDPDGNILVLTDDILIGFEDKAGESEREAVVDRIGGTVVERKPRYWKVRISDPQDDAPLERAAEVTADDAVRYAEPDALQAATPQQAPDTEPRFTAQWTLHNTGQGGGTVGADVDALGAWALTTGSPKVRVVVHDTGVDITHPDLAANIGPGRDFDDGDDDATPNPGGHPAPHGTACAGIVAADANGQGVSGIAPGCEIIPLKAAGAHPFSVWADTFEWAAENGDIISCSWTITPNNTLSDAIRAAVKSGVTVFCAAGNNGTSSVSYPASLAETIAVGASTNLDVRAAYSQFGAGLDFVAPSSGGTRRVETTDVQGTNGYNIASGAAGDYCNAADTTGFGGTSAATPLAAGVAALMLSRDRGLSPARIRTILRTTADKIDAANAGYDVNGVSTQYGYGRVNAAEAVHSARSAPRVSDVLGFGGAGVYAALSNGDGSFGPIERVIDNFAYSAGGWRVDMHPRHVVDITGDG